MVPSSTYVAATGGERLSCDDFSLNETVRFGSLELIVDHFSGLSLSPLGTAQAPLPWVPPMVGHRSHNESWWEIPPRGYSWLLVGKGGQTSLSQGDMT
jgi:hypothetical protein